MWFSWWRRNSWSILSIYWRWSSWTTSTYRCLIWRRWSSYPNSFFANWRWTSNSNNWWQFYTCRWWWLLLIFRGMLLFSSIWRMWLLINNWSRRFLLIRRRWTSFPLFCLNFGFFILSFNCFYFFTLCIINKCSFTLEVRVSFMYQNAFYFIWFAS